MMSGEPHKGRFARADGHRFEHHCELFKIVKSQGCYDAPEKRNRTKRLKCIARWPNAHYERPYSMAIYRMLV
ncbi:hypothetical protein BIW11_12230 [Tropilaelaps mercedesae]|uniref:Uncharacterized protein n=1 Tax=Tropilaelaps mercedesae TaxID=418985 RepID=A0A1V9X7Y1_9ACAR|nr:hypothetical protein BIW11_12230 [Tropilaelaps mercedesae]